MSSLKIIHIAGTNGKETVSTFLTSILQGTEPQRQKVLVGRYTTSFLLNDREAISVNNESISLKEYSEIANSLIKLDESLNLQCNTIELLTSIAFVYFAKKCCQWCIIETGLGGKWDPANLIPRQNKICCAITNVGISDEKLLCDALSLITYEYSKKKVHTIPFAVLDGSNDEFVRNAISRECSNVGCKLHITDPSLDNCSVRTDSWGTLEIRQVPYNEEDQIFNLRVAIAVLDFLKKEGKVCISKGQLSKGLISVDWPKSLHQLDYCYEANRGKRIALLLDNANNAKAAQNLASYLRTKYGDTPLTFVVAITMGKKLPPLLDPLIRTQDHVIVTRFGSVVGMPWIQSFEPMQLFTFIKDRYTKNVDIQPDLHSVWTFLEANRLQTMAPVIVCGSLYLCKELLYQHNCHLRV
ncbi:putative folylpolyglutamate synthase [Saccharomyces pastorianus]|uniref:Putative folylpolyglutamate synthase n=1 Tax=Saccharomyces pastorianus TaxID=27292 RepID=A0A6C1EC70_SACPS|nr:putative folylpolyglutamate synthase [Saccharomyces pastorianus]